MRPQYEQALIALSEQHGGNITPELVVRAAKSKDSPLHDYFDWDDKVAGGKWRIEQARELIRSVRIIVTSDKISIPAPHFVRDPQAEPEEQGYVSVLKLRSDEDRAREVVVSEFGRAAAALARAKAVAAVLNLDNEIERLHEQVTGLAERVRKDEHARD